MYVGYAVLDERCYRFSTPQALDDFLATYTAAMYITSSQAKQYDTVYNGRDLLN